MPLPQPRLGLLLAKRGREPEKNARRRARMIDILPLAIPRLMARKKGGTSVPPE